MWAEVGELGSTRPWTAGVLAARPLIGLTPWCRGLPASLGVVTDLVTVGAEYADAARDSSGILDPCPPQL